MNDRERGMTVLTSVSSKTLIWLMVLEATMSKVNKLPLCQCHLWQKASYGKMETVLCRQHTSIYEGGALMS